MPYKVNPTTGQLDYYEVSEGGGGGGATNLSFIASPTVGTVTSDSGTDADITLATTTNSGLFSPEEKIKLGIALISVGVNYRDTYNNGADYAIGDVVLYDGKLYERISNPNNPGYPPGTASWGLYDVDLGSPSFDLWIRGVLANKVDTEVGKGLSTEDYTTAEQTKLAGIAAGAEVNVNADWNADSGDAQILNKPTIPLAQVNSDWNATSGIEQILNKPSSLPTANVKHSVKYAEALTKGQAVYVSGADGTNMLVSKASNSTEATSSKTLGLVTASGAANYQGEVITEGLLDGLNTSTATVGDAVWLGTDGNLIFWHYGGSTTKPVAPAHLVFIGIVTRVSATVGEIFVKPQNGFEIDELHDVLITSLTNNQVLAYDSVTSLWKNKNLLNLTTTGYEGVATLSGNNLNIPAYKSVTYLGDFSGGDAYNAGDVVLYNNNLYFCILSIGSASAPSGDPTHWSLFLPGASAVTSEKSGSILSTARSLPFKMATGINTYRSASGVGSTTVSSTTFAGESTHYFPISLKEGSPVRAAAFRVNSAGSGGLGTAEIEVGIYNSTTNANGELIPGTLEVQFGKVSILSTGVKEAVLASPYTLGSTVDNIYWIAFRSYSTNSTSLNIYSTTDTLSSWIGMASSTGLVKLGMFIATTPYTAATGLPASLPVTGGVGFTQSTTVAGYVSNQLLIGIR